MRRCRCFVFGHAAARNGKLCSYKDNNAELRALMVEAFEIYRALDGSSCCNSGCVCTVFGKLTGSDVCLCMQSQICSTCLILVQNFHATSDQEFPLAKVRTDSHHYISFTLPLEPDM